MYGNILNNALVWNKVTSWSYCSDIWTVQIYNSDLIIQLISYGCENYAVQ